ncbi:hypothetical protein MKEN_01001300 [Mycena kentingensis (nom. inval.)]|nr:hypothetical protein MKEN_01001300 [Mycena kentingensis (nom. inval.)]
MVQSAFFTGWTLKKFNATVINDIWLDVAFFTLVATGGSSALWSQGSANLLSDPAKGPTRYKTPRKTQRNSLSAPEFHAETQRNYPAKGTIRGVFSFVEGVTCASKLTTHNLAVSNVLFAVLGTVLGLVISFRTSSSYERYQEGRKLWTTIVIASRNIAQIIWIHIPFERSLAGEGGRKLSLVESTIEKKTMLNLVQAFSVSVKHTLRDEPGIYYEDLYPLISFLPRFIDHGGAADRRNMLPLWDACEDSRYPLVQNAAVLSSSSTSSAAHGEKSTTRSSRRKKTFDPEAALANVEVHRPLAPARNPPRVGLLACLPCLGTRVTGQKPKGIRPLAESNVPFEMTIYLSSYLAYALRNTWLLPAAAGAFLTNIGTLQDTLANLDRIASTPLPFAYQAHLRMSLWLYLLFLPFQVVSLLGWLTIPGTAFAAFLFLGFLAIGQEIENPFNYDLNDLDLDGFCLSIQRELHEIAAHTLPDPSEFVFSSWNKPFAPTDGRTATALVGDANKEYTCESVGGDAGMASLRKMLVQNWKEVDRITRHSH